MYLQSDARPDTPEQEPGQAFRGQHDLVALGRFVKFLVESPRRPRSHCVIELHACGRYLHNIYNNRCVTGSRSHRVSRPVSVNDRSVIPLDSILAQVTT